MRDLGRVWTQAIATAKVQAELRVALVEDDESLRITTTELLELLGYVVASATSGEQRWRYLYCPYQIS